jgi:hypothetical protein
MASASRPVVQSNRPYRAIGLDWTGPFIGLDIGQNKLDSTQIATTSQVTSRPIGRGRNGLDDWTVHIGQSDQRQRSTRHSGRFGRRPYAFPVVQHVGERRGWLRRLAKWSLIPTGRNTCKRGPRRGKPPGRRYLERDSRFNWPAGTGPNRTTVYFACPTFLAIFTNNRLSITDCPC